MKQGAEVRDYGGSIFQFDISSDICSSLEMSLLPIINEPQNPPLIKHFNAGIVLNNTFPSLYMFIKRCLVPLSKRLFPECPSGIDPDDILCLIALKNSQRINSHAQEEDGTDWHFDDSVVTFNICLGYDFRGGNLSFETNSKTTEVEQRKGSVTAHLGKTNHCAYKITDGSRMNIILWCVPKQNSYTKSNFYNTVYRHYLQKQYETGNVAFEEPNVDRYLRLQKIPDVKLPFCGKMLTGVEVISILQYLTPFELCTLECLSKEWKKILNQGIGSRMWKDLYQAKNYKLKVGGRTVNWKECYRMVVENVQ
ncbi:hypothetical protein AKO1_014468, partial [Acrasis kona]